MTRTHRSGAESTFNALLPSALSRPDFVAALGATSITLLSGEFLEMRKRERSAKKRSSPALTVKSYCWFMRLFPPASERNRGHTARRRFDYITVLLGPENFLDRNRNVLAERGIPDFEMYVSGLRISLCACNHDGVIRPKFPVGINSVG